jgi:hypothetical protein
MNVNSESKFETNLNNLKYKFKEGWSSDIISVRVRCVSCGKHVMAWSQTDGAWQGDVIARDTMWRI